MQALKKITIIFFMALAPLCACAEVDVKSQIIQEIVQSEVYFRPWNSKSTGEAVEKNTITILYSSELVGSIAILRSQPHGFIVENYVPDNAAQPDTWVFLNNDVEKTLTKQPAGLYMILEMVDGPSGGQRIEQFRLNRDE